MTVFLAAFRRCFVAGGWGLAPGFGNSGNDNKDAQPEVLVCIRNLAEVFGSATPVSIGWTEGEVADTGTFDITVTFVIYKLHSTFFHKNLIV